MEHNLIPYGLERFHQSNSNYFLLCFSEASILVEANSEYDYRMSQARTEYMVAISRLLLSPW